MISIITINYNGLKDTLELLESLKGVGFEGEVIVVDNGSKVDETMELKRYYPQFKYIRSEDNLGFAGGNNIGIEASSGDIIMLLNNDTIITNDFTASIEEFFSTHPQVGIITPLIKFEYARDTIQYAGYTPLSTVTLRNHLIGFKEKDKHQYKSTQTNYAHGAAMAIKRTVIDHVGMMPELYFLYYEELDWCEQFKIYGYQIWFFDGATVYHKESMSTGRGSAMREYYLTRNRLLFATRNLPPLRRTISVCYQIGLSIPFHVVNHLASGRTNHAKSTVAGMLDFLMGRTGIRSN